MVGTRGGQGGWGAVGAPQGASSPGMGGLWGGREGVPEGEKLVLRHSVSPHGILGLGLCQSAH